MRKLFLSTIAGTLTLSVISIAAARTYTTNNLPYSDTPSDRPSMIAISMLTQMGVMEGDPGGTIRPNATLNRAEFMKIVMKLYDLTSDTEVPMVNRKCFPDVPETAWYAEPVCRAKAFGIVQGNARVGVPSSQWLFEPTRPVQYEEAVKVLVKLYALPTTEMQTGHMWYQPYIQAAVDEELAVSGLVPGDKLRRGEMARLVANFLAWSEGELDKLRAAEQGTSLSSSRSSRSSQNSSRSSTSSRSSLSSMSSRSSKSSAGSAGSIDPNPNVSVKSDFLLLDEDSPAIAGVRFFSDSEPLSATRIIIQLSADVPTVESILVYDENQKYLGLATHDSGTLGRYSLTLSSGKFALPYRVSVSMYLRARVKPHHLGGESGQVVHVSTVTVQGTGDWSSSEYNQASVDTFPSYETARGVFTVIRNDYLADDVLSAGTDQVLGRFRFESKKSDNQATVRLTTVRFTIESSGVTVTNPHIHVEGVSEAHDCTISGSVITCSGIPANFGTVDSLRVIRVYSDVSINSGAVNPFLRITINNPGDFDTTGDITWTDGEGTFTWVPFEQPIARGTMMR